MTIRPDIPEDVWLLINRLLDETITADELATLESNLRGDAEMQALLLEMCQFHALVSVNSRTDRIIDECRKAIDAGATEIVGNRPRPAPIAQPASGIGALFDLKHLGGMGTAGALFGLLLAVASVAYLAWTSMDDGQRVANVALPAEFQPTTVTLDRGTTQVVLDQVGSVILDGPAELDLIAPKRARLRHGRIKVHVSEDLGHGFVLETPDGDITDLGTEFCVNVAKGSDTQLVVLDGAVDLRLADAQDGESHRFTSGEAVSFNRRGDLERLIAIVTGRSGTFEPLTTLPDGDSPSVIRAVTDNLLNSDTKKFYEIVPGGFGENAQTFADRPKLVRWQSTKDVPLPAYLIGADYVKTFNDDKTRSDIAIEVTIARPAKLYVLIYEVLPVPDWLRNDYRRTGDGATMQVFVRKTRKTTIERFDVWERVISEPGVVRLGASALVSTPLKDATMYAIVAVPLEQTEDKGK